MTAPAVVDLRHGEDIVNTYSRTAKGVRVLDGPPVRLGDDSAVDPLGVAINEALDQSRDGLCRICWGMRISPPTRRALGRPRCTGTVYRDGDTVEVGTAVVDALGAAV